MSDIVRPGHSRKYAQHSKEWSAACDDAFRRAMAQEAPQTFLLPWPVSTNALYRAVRVGARSQANILSKPARDWYELAGWELQKQKPIPIKGPIRLHIVLGPPNKRLFDPDGKLKATIDLLVRHKVIEDDNWRIIPEGSWALDWSFVGAKVTVKPRGEV
jgi:Holliday junction resolvase RusA-like endonuclease